MTIAATGDHETCFALRRRVFVDEQGVPASEERDALDASAIHLLAYHGGAPVGTARIVLGIREAKIGRVCVLPALRGTGLGKGLIHAAMAAARARGQARVRLGAQMHALGFYEQLGFIAEGPVYDDAGIDHRDMVRDL